MKKILWLFITFCIVSTSCVVYADSESQKPAKIKTIFHKIGKYFIGYTDDEIFVKVFDKHYTELNEKYRPLLLDIEQKNMSECSNMYQSFQKNDMRKNREYCDKLDSWIKENNELIDEIYKEYDSLYDDFHYELNKRLRSKYYLETLKAFMENIAESRDYFIGMKIIDLLRQKNSEYRILKKEIVDYSYNYEKNRYVKYMKANGKKFEGGTVASIIYMPYSYDYDVPTSNYIYNTSSIYPLQVKQVLNGGILVGGSYISGGLSPQRNIFIITNNSYVTGQTIGYMNLEYKGTFSYRTVLGSSQTVYKFQNMTQAAVDNNFKTPFENYFYFPPN